MATTTATSGSAQAIYDALNQRTEKKTSAVGEQQSRFLTLLTTQLKNQDPLNPMDNAQMTSQLAQISTVDGIERLNATLQQLLSGTTDTQAMQAAALTGHTVLVAGNGMQLIEGLAGGGFELAGVADSVKVTIKDANGLVVRTLNLGEQDEGVQTFTWDGKNDAGALAANGSYRISVEATQGDKAVKATALELTGVASINRSSQGVTLNLGNGGVVAMSDIKQIF
ncbi:MAG: flagellar hook assembly protein FlgD [Rhodocyclaceae bacterium]|nr:flagellar hook assembly protein FlgD [Rhodocyclaceae bacterium]